ncbi:MAG: hypothetical protein WBE71_13895, partial [Xanthobacteraceae bacterium]
MSSSNPLGRAISVLNYERRTPPISRLKRRQGAQQFRLRSDDANFLVGDLDALSQRAQMIAAVAAIFEPGLDRIERLAVDQRRHGHDRNLEQILKLRGRGWRLFLAKSGHPAR